MYKHQPLLRSFYSPTVCTSNASAMASSWSWNRPVSKYTLFTLLLLCYLTGHNTGQGWMVFSYQRDTACVGILCSSEPSVPLTPPVSQKEPAQVLKWLCKTLIPTTDFLIWETPCNTERQVFCQLWAVPSPQLTNEVFFPRSFIHPNALLLCILHSFLLFFSPCCSAPSPFLMNFFQSLN